MDMGVTFSSQAMSNAPGPAEESQAANEGVRDKNPNPPTVLTAVEHMNLQKTGSSKDPAGEPENMGSWAEKRYYSAEQQERLEIDAKGNRVAKQAAAGVDNFSASEPEAEEADAEAAAENATRLAQPAVESKGSPPPLLQSEALSIQAASKSLQAASQKVSKAPEVEANEKAHDDMVMSLQLKVEMERQMQRLAMAHFAFWHFWFLFIPAAALTMASGILAFLSTSDAIEEGNRTLLVTVVGCLALVATFLQTINDLLKYGSRAEMHRSAAQDLKAIYDALDFMQISRIGGTTRHADVMEYQKIYSQVQQGCKSLIPLRVIQSFNTVDTRILSQIPVNKEVNFEGKVGINQLVLTLSNEMYCAITQPTGSFPSPSPTPTASWSLSSSACTKPSRRTSSPQNGVLTLAS